MEDALKMADALRAEAAECRATSRRAGEYNTAFWVAAIVLDNIANRLIAEVSRQCGDA